MLAQLIESLVRSNNQASDDVLLEAIKVGSEVEQALAIDALMRRQTTRGLRGLIAAYAGLSDALQERILANIKTFYHALREAGRSAEPAEAISAMKLISRGRQGRLTYILSEGLHGTDPAVASAACEAIVELARWVTRESKALQQPIQTDAEFAARSSACQRLLEERPEIEHAVARAMDVHRGKFGGELLRAALVLADWPESQTLAILDIPRHGGQSAMVRRLQQPPQPENVPAFLLAASHEGLRSHFGVTFSHIVDSATLDAFLQRTHWLKDQRLQMCVHQIQRAAWLNDLDLDKEISQRLEEDVARIGEWIAASGVHEVLQDDKLERLRAPLADDPAGRLRLLRIAARRGRGIAVSLLRSFIADPDERLARIAVREIIRRRPPDFQNMLLTAMPSAGLSVRRIISRAVGHVGFDHFWNRFESLDQPTRQAGGRALLKVLPDGLVRLGRKLRSPEAEERMKAIAVAHQLGVAESLSDGLLALCGDSNARVRSRAVAVLAEVRSMPPDELLKKVLNDSDARVRANAIEVLETKERADFVPVLTERARSAASRERANAIKALHRLRVGTASTQLINMLQDDRPDHRISALWALKQIGLWKMLNEVARLAREDTNLKVRRYAITVLRGVADLVRDRQAKAG